MGTPTSSSSSEPSLTAPNSGPLSAAGSVQASVPASVGSNDEPTPAAVAEVFWANDRASRGLGMRLDAIAKNYARVSMIVTEPMTNGFGICHGGFIFTLADSSMAYASNSTNQESLAVSALIDFLAPARLGETLTAEARLHWQGGRTGITDSTVTNQRGEVIALFHGRTARTGRPVLKPEIPFGPARD